MAYEHIKYDKDGPILTITLSRPDKLNAFTETMMHELIDAFDKSDADDEIRAVVVTGDGRAFCAGADLSSGGDTFDYDARGRGKEPAGVPRDGGGRVTLRIYESLKPVIAAVNGPAVGVGVTMQLPMDIRLASENAKFGFVFSRRGIVPEAASGWFLPRAVGMQQALEWVYTGRVFDAEEAKRGGLIREVYPADQLLPKAYELANEIAENTSGLSVAWARHMMWRLSAADHPMEAHKVDSRAIYEMGRGKDAREGVTSFLEKRPAAFPGKVSQDMPESFHWWEDRKFS